MDAIPYYLTKYPDLAALLALAGNKKRNNRRRFF